MSDELTDRAYWERTWNDANIPMSVDLTDHGIRNHATLTVHRHFETVLCAFRGRQTSLIELGCAQSKWLPYFACHWRFDVAGLDSSELGCRRARQMLAASGVAGEIVYGDLFKPPREMLERYEIVFSHGLVEHFKDTASAIAACAAFVRPGGTILTIIPNLVGIVGVLQSALDHKVYDAHVPMDADSLAAAHRNAGLSVVNCEYLLSANFAVVNHPGLRPRLLNHAVRSVLIGATGLVWAIERMGVHMQPSRRLSPYVACVATKPRLLGK